MAKYKILVIPSDNYGCGKFRSIDPHECLRKKYGDIFEIDIMFGKEVFEYRQTYPEFLKKYDLIHIHKQFDFDGYFISVCKYLGKLVVVDVDDHYDLGSYHPMSYAARKENWAERVLVHIRNADWVTTTQDVFRKILLKNNKNVFVLPNAIDPTEEQFQINTTKSDRLRVGIVCGSTHLEDLKLFGDMVAQFSKEELDRLQFVLCGFDTKGSVTRFLENGEKVVLPLNPTETCWYKYEQILTNDYKSVSKEHADFLHEFVPNQDFANWENEPYRRCWTKDIKEYATHYNSIDVLLAPLVNNPFTIAKSNLKVIEAGFCNKALIVSHAGPYGEDLISAIGKNGVINPDGNCLLVEPTKNKNWVKYIRLLLNNKDLLLQLQHNLHETVKDKYDLRNITDIRKDFYLKILEEKK